MQSTFPPFMPTPVPADLIAGLCLDNPDVVDAISLRFAGQRVTLSDQIPERQASTLPKREYREVAQ